MAQEINTYDWKAVKVCITKQNIDGFVVLSNRREIRPAQVAKILRALKAGEHFESPFVANKVGGKYRLIDGNHRLEAIRKFIALDNRHAVEVEVKYYENLSEEEERHRFKQWNSGLRQTTNDYIRQYWDDMPVIKHMTKAAGFPVDVGVVWTVNHVELKLLLAAYFPTRRGADIPYSGAATLNGEDFVAEVKKMKKADVDVLRAFLLDHIAVFGAPDRKALPWKPACFSALADIWIRNYKLIPTVILRKKLEAVIGSERLHYWGAQGGSLLNCVNARKDFVELMNRKQKAHPVV